MTLASWLRVSSSPLDMFLRSERLTPLEKLRNAPQFPLAFEGPLLPLSAHEPALPPLFALPPPLGARSPDIGVLPTKGNITFALQRYYIFPYSVCQRANISKKNRCRLRRQGRWPLLSSRRCALVRFARCVPLGHPVRLCVPILVRLAEERAPVPKGNRGAIATVKRARAGKAAIVRIAPAAGSAKPGR